MVEEPELADKISGSNTARSASCSLTHSANIYRIPICARYYCGYYGYSTDQQKSLPLWNSAERQRNECPSGEMEKSLKGEGVGVWRPESFSEKLALQQRAEGNVR